MSSLPSTENLAVTQFRSTENDLDWSSDDLEKGSDYDISEGLDELTGVNSDDSDNEDNNITFSEFVEEREINNPTFKIGLTFRSLKQFKEAVKNYSVLNRCKIGFPNNDRKRCKAKCKEGYPFMIWASTLSDNDDTAQIKSLNLTHTCTREYTNKNCSAKYFANKYLEGFRHNPNWTVSGIMERVRSDLSITIDRCKAARAKAEANKLLEADEVDQFNMLYQYIHELLKASEGMSTIIMKLNSNIFDRFYVCFNGCKMGFTHGCRHIIGVDECFLKGRWSGQLLTAIGLDANNQLYPIAFGIVDRETKDSWDWFLKLLSDDLQIVNSYDWTFMPDRQNGIIPAIKELFPNSEHRFCVRHMYTNFRTQFKGKTLKDYLWNASRAYHVADFRKWMEKIKVENELAHEWLCERPAQQWSTSHFSFNSKSDILLNNLCESFNHMILPARDKPILSMLKELINCLMRRISKKKAWGSKLKGKIYPKPLQKLEKSKKVAILCTIEPTSCGSKYQVWSSYGQHVVDMATHNCSCRSWDLSGIPCPHVVAVIMDNREDPENYVDSCYSVLTYNNMYSHTIEAIEGKEHWDPPIINQLVFPPRLVQLKKGRMKRLKNKEPEECENSTKIKKPKTGVNMTCSKCKEKGHNIRFHGVKSKTSTNVEEAISSSTPTTDQPRE